MVGLGGADRWLALFEQLGGGVKNLGVGVGSSWMRHGALPSPLHASAGAWGRGPAPRANKKQKEGTTGK